MRNWITCFIVSAALSGCVGNSVVTKQFDRYRALAAEPIPDDWKPGAIWTFVTTDRAGRKDSLTFRVLDKAADTCTSGDWRALELLEGDAGSLARTPFEPAALVQGRNLWISLASNWCDIENDLKGELQGDGFNGLRTSGGMTGNTVLGQVQGWRVK